MYINTQTNKVVSEQDIKLANPNTSFSIPFNPPAIYKWIFPAPQPTYDPIIQSVREIAPVLTGLGHYEQRWEIVNLYITPEEEAAAIEADALAKFKASIPASITMRQARLALNAVGLLATVSAAVAAADEATKIEWEYAATLDRNWPTLAALSAALGMTEFQVDQLFLAALAY